jgi:hypothetical protein
MRALNNLTKLTNVVILSITLMSFNFFEPVSAPKPKIWPQWETFNPVSLESINHNQWDQILKVYLKKNINYINLMDYGRLKKDGKKALDEYIEVLNETPISLYSRNEQKAFWINLYNALTVQIIAAYYPVNSILEIPSAWDKKLAKVNGIDISLNDIQHKILRPIWRDALIHYSLNQGALSSPNLLRIAFTGRNVNQLIELASHSYINNHPATHIRNGNLVVSKMYSWFKEDFGGTDQNIIFHLRNFAEVELLEILEKKNSIKTFEFDWSLNDTDS